MSGILQRLAELLSRPSANKPVQGGLQQTAQLMSPAYRQYVIDARVNGESPLDPQQWAMQQAVLLQRQQQPQPQPQSQDSQDQQPAQPFRF